MSGVVRECIADLLEDTFKDLYPKYQPYTQFTPWLRLKTKDYKNHLIDDVGGQWPIGDYPGVYLVAHWSDRGEPPPGPASPLDPRVVYIGRSKHLSRRWYQLLRTVELDQHSHSGASSLREALAELARAEANAGAAASDITTPSSSVDISGQLAHTYVAGLPVWVGDAQTPGVGTHFQAAYIEAALVHAVCRHRRAQGTLSTLLNKE
jgi:hypothetical protein